jgi:protein-disulfide isomerase
MAEAKSTTKSAPAQKPAKKSSGGMMDKIVPILLVATIVLAFGVGILWQKVNTLEGGSGSTSTGSGQAGAGAGNAPPPEAPPPANGKLSEDQVSNFVQVSSSDHLKGNPDAKVVIVEYSDYECPFCQRFHPTVQQALDEYGDDVAWVYRHYPLTFIHPKAQEAAESAECVAELAGNDAFWEFSDLVFEGTPESLQDISSLAVQVGANQSEFEACVESEKYADLVQEQLDSGSAIGINGTPGTVIVNQNGDAWLVPGAVPYESLKQTIDEALEA